MADVGETQQVAVLVRRLCNFTLFEPRGRRFRSGLSDRDSSLLNASRVHETIRNARNDANIRLGGDSPEKVPGHTSGLKI